MKGRIAWLLGALLAGWAEPALAGTQTFGNYCRVGAVQTCASIHVVTVWDPVAKVTRVEIWVRNLQGTNPADNTLGGAITRVGLTSPGINNPAGLTVRTEGATEHGTAPGSYWGISRQQIEGPVTFAATTGTNGANGGIQGCNVYPSTVQNYFQTCGGGWVVFSFTTTNQWDAANAQIAWKIYVVATDGKMYYACRSEADPSSAEFCEVVDPTLTPEPASMALLGGGLAGLAALGRRRRRRQEEAPRV